MKLNIEQYKAFLEELAKSKKVELGEIKKKMANCGPPGVTAAAGAVRRPCLFNFTLYFAAQFMIRKFYAMIFEMLTQRAI